MSKAQAGDKWETIERRGGQARGRQVANNYETSGRRVMPVKTIGETMERPNDFVPTSNLEQQVAGLARETNGETTGGSENSEKSQLVTAFQDLPRLS